MKDFKVLDWDSKFFGFKVAQINEDALSNEVIKKIHKENVELAYYTSTVELDLELFQGEYDIHLVDQKVSLYKALVRETEVHPNVFFYSNNDAEKKLIELAYHAGSSTRFKIDPKISEQKYRELFEIWVTRSVKKEIADFVLVYKINDLIVGFAAIAINGSEPYVSLLAVDPKFEGKGIAFALMRSIERILRDRGFCTVTGATQSSNRKALVVYERYGLRRGTVKFVYHLWRKPI